MAYNAHRGANNHGSMGMLHASPKTAGKPPAANHGSAVMAREKPRLCNATAPPLTRRSNKTLSIMWRSW